MSRPARLQLIGLKKRFGARIVLDGVDLEIHAGRSLAIIGGSGTGKSVLLKCTLGLTPPDEGRVVLDGRDIAALKPTAHAQAMRNFGMLFQGAALFDSRPIWENVAFRLLHADRMPPREARARALDALQRVRLPREAADLRPGELSGGMQKRAGLARAIIANPKVLFLDEPTTGLDPITADAINDLIVDMVKDLGCAAVSITHDMASVRKIADEVAMLHAGKIIWRGPAAEIDHTDHPSVAQFVSGRAQGPMTGSAHPPARTAPEGSPP